jgi:hypothetical protein
MHNRVSGSTMDMVTPLPAQAQPGNSPRFLSS